jgi:hypothetical protein
MMLVIAASSTGFSINRHFCGGKEKSKAVIIDADKCAFESKPICRKHETNSVSKKACCSDDSEYYKQHFQADNLVEISKVDLNIPVAPVAILVFNDYTNNQVEKSTPVYRPPPLKEPLFILHQSFLL